MKHPDEAVNQQNELFLKSIAPESRRYHELLIKIQNARFVYFEQIKGIELTEDDWEDYLDSLPHAKRMEKELQGFTEIRETEDFKKFYLQSRGYDLTEFMERNITYEEMNEFRSLLNKS